MEKVLIDTDVIIDFLRGHQERIRDFFDQIEAGKLQAYTSWINVTELYSGADSNEKDEILQNVLKLFTVLDQNHKSARLSGQLRQKYQLGIADAIIASLAISNKLTLYTFNAKDFKKVPSLQLFSL